MVELDQAGSGRGWLRELAVPGRLAGWVQQAWVHARPEAAATAGRAWRIVADANAHIIISRGRRSGAPVRAVLVGARSVHADTNIAVRAWTVGIRLHAGALTALTGMPANELTDVDLPLDALSAATACGVSDRLKDVRTCDAAADVILRFVAHVLPVADADTVRSARLLRALGHARPATVRQAAAALGVAERTLHHLCVTRVGLAPRRILRIMRLHRVLEHALTHDHHDDGWARIAAMHGYADQSHLIRDFKALLGEPPAAFLRRSSLARD